MSYLVTIVQNGQETRLKLGHQDNVLIAIDWAIRNQYGIHVKEVSAFEMIPSEECKRAYILWSKIEGNIV